jgi:hypothetical protein
MTMRAINLANYSVTVRQQTANGIEEKEISYEVRKSLITVLFGQQGLGAVEILDRDDLARAIRDSGDVFQVDEAGYERLVGAVKAFTNYGQNDAELVRRVLKAQ